MKIEVKEMETGLRVLAMEIDNYAYYGSLRQPIYENGSLDVILVIYVKKGEKGGGDESQGS